MGKMEGVLREYIRLFIIMVIVGIRVGRVSYFEVEKLYYYYLFLSIMYFLWFFLECYFGL